MCVFVCIFCIHTFPPSPEIKSQNSSVAVSTSFAQTLISKHLGEVADLETGVKKI